LNMVCQAPTCTDMQRNGSEADTDCGMVCPNKCVSGQHCVVPADCQNNTCSSGTCGSSVVLCHDNIQNQDETDIDWGGVNCLPCADTKACLLPRDCTHGFCSGNKCGVGFGAPNVVAGPPTSVWVATGQVNSTQDAYVDLAMTNSTGNTVNIFLGDGTG